MSSGYTLETNLSDINEQIEEVSNLMKELKLN